MGQKCLNQFTKAYRTSTISYILTRMAETVKILPKAI